MTTGFRFSNLLATVALASALVFASLPGAIAAEGDKTENPVIATVNGKKIYASELTEAQARLPAEYKQVPPAILFGLLLNSLIDSKLTAAEALRQGLDKDPEVARDLTRIRDNMLQRAYLTKQIDGRMTEEAMKARYEKLLTESNDEDEVRASHILVETEAQAKEIIVELSGGAEFVDLAKAKSIGPSSDKGGDLGFFKRDNMVAEFADAAFALGVDETTATPVRTQYGWHVIRVAERRKANPPMFEEVEADLRNKLSREIGAEILQGLRDGADIQRFGPDGSVIKETPK